MSDLLEIHLKVDTGEIPPYLRITVNDNQIFDGVVCESMTLRHQTELTNRLTISMEKSGKTKMVVDSGDHQTVIADVSLNGLDQHADTFGVFEQRNNPYVDDAKMEGNHMSLNGCWQLDVPVFRQPFMPELKLNGGPRDTFSDARIACFGCSFTYGSFLEYDQTWPYYLGDAKNYGMGGHSISAIVGSAHWYVQNFKCDKLVMLLPDVYRFQIQNQQKEWWSWCPSTNKKFSGGPKELIRDVVMFGEASLLFSGGVNRMKELLAEINEKTDLYITSWSSETYDMLIKKIRGESEILPFYERSSEFRMAPDDLHPGPDHNRFFANEIRPIIGG